MNILSILSDLAFIAIIIVTIACIWAMIKGNYFVSKILKTKSDAKIPQNDNLKYLDGAMNTTGMPDIDAENHYENVISAQLNPESKKN